MTIYEIIILSIVEGITEFLPISSTGHLILTSHLLGVPQNEILKTFEISIQIGPIAAIALLYYQKLLKEKALLLKALIGFIPTGIIGLLFYPLIKNMLGSELIVVSALFIGGLAIIIIEYIFGKTSNKNLKNLDTLTLRDALSIGLMQSVSMIPGVSRSAASIFGGLALRLDRKSAAEFSFLLAIPTMAAATSLDLIQEFPSFSTKQALYLLLGIILSFIVALIVVKWLLGYIQNHNFIYFGIYRIIFSILYALLFIF